MPSSSLFHAPCILLAIHMDRVHIATMARYHIGATVTIVMACRFFVLVVVYLVGGVLVLRFGRGARGAEQIPNLEFWKDFPSLVKVSLGR